VGDNLEVGFNYRDEKRRGLKHKRAFGDSTWAPGSVSGLSLGLVMGLVLVLEPTNLSFSTGLCSSTGGWSGLSLDPVLGSRFDLMDIVLESVAGSG